MQIPEQVNLVALIEARSGINLKQSCYNYRSGVEYCGPCPFCQMGNDRFHVWPEATSPSYWCRVCERSGNAIQFLRDYCHLSFVQACQALNITLEPGTVANKTGSQARIVKHKLPSQEWQETGDALVHQAQKILWGSSLGEPWLAYLRNRGLSDDMIRTMRLGYIPTTKSGQWLTMPSAQWGLDINRLRPSQRQSGLISIPDGITIPWYEGKTLWKIALKRPAEEPSYQQIVGSGDGMYNIDTLKPGHPCMMVESEFCALAVTQVAGDLISCIATGSTTRGRALRWQRRLERASYVLQSFDNDPVGADGKQPGDIASLYWTTILPHAYRYAPTPYKDPNEILMHNGPEALRAWVKTGLERQ